MKTFKKITLIVADGEQEVSIYQTDTGTIILESEEVFDKKAFKLYLTAQEAKDLSAELNVFALGVEYVKN